MTTLNQKQGSVVAVSHDMIMVRFEGKGVLFKKQLLSRTYKHDDIVQFNAKKATTVDIEVGDKMSQMAGYEIGWLGTEIKYIKSGRMIIAEGSVINIPDEKAQYMFVDWKFTKNPPALAKIPGYNKPLTTNVFVTRASVRPEVEKLTEMFKPGQRVKFVAREQAPNERGVCWRAALVTDQHHDIVTDPPNNIGRITHRAVPKSTTSSRPSASPVVKPSQSALVPSRASASNLPSTSSASPVRSASRTIPPIVRPSPLPVVKSPEPPVAPPTIIQKTNNNNWSPFEIQKPPPIDGFDYFDVSKEACDARFKNFALNYRNSNPNCLFSNKYFEGILKIKYLNQLTEEITAIRAAQMDF